MFSEHYANPGTTLVQPFVTSAELEMLDRIASELPKNAFVLGNPFNGSTFVYVIANRDVVFTYFGDVWDSDANYLAAHFANADNDPEVCAAIRRLGVDYFYFDPVRYSPGVQSFGGLNAKPGPSVNLVPVDSGGTAALYRIEGCR
jgi:hypothetical protein